MKPEEILFLLFLIFSGISMAAGLRAIVLKVRKSRGKRNSSPPAREGSSHLNGKHPQRATEEQLARLRDPVTGHLRSRTWVMRKYVELRRAATGHDSRQYGEG